MRTSLLIALLLCGIPAPAGAHRGSTCKVKVRVQDAEVTVTVAGTRHDLAPTLGVAEGVNPIAALYRQKQDMVLRHVAGYVTVGSGGGRVCPVRKRTLHARGEGDIRVELSYRCARRVEVLQLRYDLLFDQDATHRAMVAVDTGDGQTAAAVLSTGKRELTVDRHVSPWLNARDFLVLGVEHIFTGLDHVLFIIGLLLAAGLRGKGAEARARGLGEGAVYLLKVVTAFTVAHSLTLVGAALGWVSLPATVVEPAIAASIMYVGLENLVLGDPRRRWLLAGLFGLVHGFGFAFILTEVGLPRSGLVLSLLAFNLGVEAGQVTLVLCLFPLIHLLARRWPRVYRVGLLWGGSAAIVGLGGYWLVGRVFGG